MTDFRADVKKAVEFGIARFAPIWQLDWNNIMAESRGITDRELMQQALDAMLNFPNDISDKMFESIRSLRARLAQPEQEADICCQDFENCRRSCIPLGQWIARVYCGCGDQIMPNDGAECGNCVAARNA